VGAALLPKTRAEQTKVSGGGGLAFAQCCRLVRQCVLLGDVQVPAPVSVSARLNRPVSDPSSPMLGCDRVESCVGWERLDIRTQVPVRLRLLVRVMNMLVVPYLLVWPGRKVCEMVSQWRFQSGVSSLDHSCRVLKDASQAAQLLAEPGIMIGGPHTLIQWCT
jgi:hypothetical protein